jgi:hypothetical protein
MANKIMEGIESNSKKIKQLTIGMFVLGVLNIATIVTLVVMIF